VFIRGLTLDLPAFSFKVHGLKEGFQPQFTMMNLDRLAVEITDGL
jgi:hypothetical protein